jgi:hypothetical protein
MVAIVKKTAGPKTGLSVLFPQDHYPETCRSGSPDDTQYQGYHGQYDQYMDKSTNAVYEYTQKPTYQKYNCYQIK